MREKHKQTAQANKYAPLSDYSSSIKHILIPLPGFKNYHQTGTESIEDKNFIGRDTIIAKLKSWLSNDQTYTGAYLITGYRGMGKSSFVGKVLYDLSHQFRPISTRIHTGVKLALIFLAGYICHRLKMEETLDSYPIAVGIISCVVFLILMKIRTIPKGERTLRNIGKLCKDLISIKGIRYIPVRINVGNEILRDKEILHLICKSVNDKFTEYAQTRRIRSSYLALIIGLFLICVVFAYMKSPFPIHANTYKEIYAPLLSLNEIFIHVWRNYPIGPALGFILLLCLFFCLEKIVPRIAELFHLYPYPSLRSIEKRLDWLCDRSVATVSEDYSSLTSYIPFNPFRKKSYPAASVREIEQGLISIFEDIHLQSKSKLRFIIIFDELDKIDMKEMDIGDVNEEPTYDLSASGFSGTLNTRKRKEMLMKTLGDMKYFLSTVKAKFIFIAGRELYDAYLTDVSDREFSISSVFDGVIHVNSFLKPPSHDKGITAMTEEYICERLFPQEADKERYERTLKKYYQYEIERLALDKDGTPNREKLRKRTIRNVSLLYQYSMYLSHISNGSPKKIAIYFEKEIRPADYLRSKGYVLEEKDCCFYLSFGVKDIQRIGFMYYIASPITQTMINMAKIYEDKLLVSTSFMINHIYKYHNNGFSWRNLEHIPELLEINKTPEFRDFVGSIVSMLRQTHLESISSGLYQFKFPLKISEEISFLSKRSEAVSAIFHFSRDESLPIKKHYIKLLKYYTNDLNKINDEELYTLASIHHILADIYLMDEDYSQAIFEYQTGLQLLSKQLSGSDYDKDSHWISHMLFLVRNMLKLGLTYEKRKTFDSAYIAYSELANRLVDYRRFKEEEWDLRYAIQEHELHSEKDAIVYPIKTKNKKAATKGNKIIPSNWENKHKGYAFQGDHIRSEFARILSPEKSSIIMRMSFFNDIRLAYLPALAKLFVLEKISHEGITLSNLDIIEAEYFYLHIATDDSEKVMASADFFQKLGDIMYYKNGLITNQMNNIFQSLYFWGYDLKKLIDDICLKEENGRIKERGSNSYYENRRKMEEWFSSIEKKEYEKQIVINNIEGLKEYIKAGVREKLEEDPPGIDWDNLFNSQFPIDIEKSMGCMKHRSTLLQRGKRLPCHACKYYNQSLSSIMERILHITHDKTQSSSVELFGLLLNSRSSVTSLNEKFNSLIANTLKGMGNVLLGCSHEEYKLASRFLQDFFDGLKLYYSPLSSSNNKATLFSGYKLNSLEKALLYTAEASIFFEISGDKHSSFLMNKQIIEIFNAYLRIHFTDSDINLLIPFLGDIEDLACRSVMQLYSHYEHVNIAEIQKLKHLFGRDIYENVNLNTLPLSPDIEEVIYRYYTLEIKCKRYDCIKDLYACTLMGPYKQISTLSQNVANLRFKVLMNEKIFDEICGWSIDFNSGRYKSKSKYIETLHNYFRIDPSVFQILKEYNINIKGDNSMDDKIHIINFFISDSLFCLSKIFELIIPLNNTTLFSYSFIGEISEHLCLWNFMFENLYLLYVAVDHIDEDPSKYNGKALLERYDQEKDRDEELYHSFDQLRNAIANKTSNRTLSSHLMDLIRRHISQDGFQHLINNYQVESAIQNYSRAIEMHTEGKAYKEMIKSLYFLDDDLNNDSCQQLISIERYYINCGFIDRKINYLKGRATQSPIYRLDSYLTEIK